MESKLKNISLCFKIIDTFLSELDTTNIENIPDGLKYFTKKPLKNYYENNYNFEKIVNPTILQNPIAVGGAPLIDELRTAINADYSACLEKLNSLKRKIKNKSLKHTIYFYFTEYIIQPERITGKYAFEKISFILFLFTNLYFTYKAQKLEIEQLINFYESMNDNELLNKYNPSQTNDDNSLISTIKPFYFIFSNMLINLLSESKSYVKHAYLSNNALPSQISKETFSMFFNSFVNLHSHIIEMPREEFYEYIENIQQSNGNRVLFYDTIYYTIMYYIPLLIIRIPIENLLTFFDVYDRYVFFRFLRQVDLFNHYLNIDSDLYTQFEEISSEMNSIAFPLDINVNDGGVRLQKANKFLSYKRLKNINKKAIRTIDELITIISETHNGWFGSLSLGSNQVSGHGGALANLVFNYLNQAPALTDIINRVDNSNNDSDDILVAHVDNRGNIVHIPGNVAGMMIMQDGSLQPGTGSATHHQFFVNPVNFPTIESEVRNLNISGGSNEEKNKMESKLNDLYVSCKIINFFLSDLDISNIKNVPDGIKNFSKSPTTNNYYKKVSDFYSMPVLNKEIAVSGGAVLFDELKDAVYSEYSKCINKLDSLKKKIKNKTFLHTIYFYFSKYIIAPENITIAPLKKSCFLLFFFGNMILVKNSQKMKQQELIDFYNYYHENQIMNTKTLYHRSTSLMKNFKFKLGDFLSMIFASTLDINLVNMDENPALAGVEFGTKISSVIWAFVMDADWSPPSRPKSFSTLFEEFVKIHSNVLSMSREEFNEFVIENSPYNAKSIFVETVFYCITTFIPFMIILIPFDKLLSLLNVDQYNLLHGFLRKVDSFRNYFQYDSQLYETLLDIEETYTLPIRDYRWTPWIHWHSRVYVPPQTWDNDPSLSQYQSSREINYNTIAGPGGQEEFAMRLIEEIFNNVVDAHNNWISIMSITNNNNMAGFDNKLSKLIFSYLEEKPNAGHLINQLDITINDMQLDRLSNPARPTLEASVRNMQIGGIKSKKTKKKKYLRKKHRTRMRIK